MSCCDCGCCEYEADGRYLILGYRARFRSIEETELAKRKLLEEQQEK